MATMKYKDMFLLSPKSNHKDQKFDKIIWMRNYKKESGKKKDNLGNSNMMRSGSTSAMFQNSISESTSKKKLSRQKTSSVLKTIPYSLSQNMLGSTMSTSNPTIAMFNSIISSQK